MEKQTQRTPEQVQAWFHENGISVADWSAQHGFSTALVYAVMKGKRPCLRGESHRIAVALGLKGFKQSLENARPEKTDANQA